jgi:hypothetical protein
MRGVLKGRVLLAVVLCVVLILSGGSVAIFADVLSGKDVATQGYFHLTCSPLQLRISPGQGPYIDPADAHSISGNLFTFTHPNTPNNADITAWTFSFKPTPSLNPPQPPELANKGTIAGKFTISVNLPGQSFGDAIGEIYVDWNANYEFVPKLTDEPTHYNFEGPFKIKGGSGFYEGIQGEGTIGGTFHRHNWGDQQEQPWFDFVMIGKAKFPR